MTTFFCRHYTNRAFLPPSHITFLSHLPSSHASRAIYNAFPIPHLASGLGVRILEPDYPQNAAAVLARRDTLGPSQRREPSASHASRKLAKDSGVSAISAEQAKAIVRLGDVAELGAQGAASSPDTCLTRSFRADMRQVPDLTTFLRLLRSDSFATASSIRLIKLDEPTPADQYWRHWQLPSILDKVETCLELHKMPFCDAICRGSKEGHFTFPGEWPQVQLGEAP